MTDDRLLSCRGADAICAVVSLALLLGILLVALVVEAMSWAW